MVVTPTMHCLPQTLMSSGVEGVCVCRGGGGKRVGNNFRAKENWEMRGVKA